MLPQAKWQAQRWNPVSDDSEFVPLVAELAERCEARGLRVVTAESCTGGWIAKVLTDRAGSSGWFDRGLVTYSNTAKQALLGVDAALIDDPGAVSREVAEAMARGALAHSGADLAVAVSGIAGPEGGSEDKPVGTVWFAWARGDELRSAVACFEGDREAVRRATVKLALRGLVDSAGNPRE